MSKLSAMEPHTAAKHLLLKRYVDCWFPILGKRFERINYIDGFAGPGEYESGEVGSPVLAIESAKAHVASGNLREDVEINFLFIEFDPGSASHFESILTKIEVPSGFNIRVVCGTFADHIESILDGIKMAGSRLAPTFAFVDPLGFSGIPFELLSRILAYPACEVFVNIMVEFINRFLEHPDHNVVTHFPSTFGTDEVLEIPNRTGDRVMALLDLYRRQLRSRAKFVGQFDMRGRRDRKKYSLFFATNHPRGFEKMKDAMWSVDKVQGASFSDADPNCQFAFDLFGFDPVWEDLADQFSGKRVAMADIERFVIEKTDYLPKHARAVFKAREESGEIDVESVPGHKRRKGTFPKGKVYIRFK